MNAGRRKRPQKALTRKDFRYKRDWKHYKENEQDHEFEEDLREEFEDHDDTLDKAGVMFVVGLFGSFLKMLDLGGSSVGVRLDEMVVVVYYVLGFLVVAGINAIGNHMTKAKGKKTRITGHIFETFSYLAFGILFYFMQITN